LHIIIPGQTRAKKNSMMVIRLGNRYSIKSSKIYTEWAKKALKHLSIEQYNKWEGGYPITLSFFFYRENKRKFDYGNMIEGTQDILQQAGIIEDDDMNHVIPVILGWAIDKNNPRTEIWLHSTTPPSYQTNPKCERQSELASDRRGSILDLF
jgi:Holliday junction resolvase RusA-like endonuclease